MFTVLEFDRNNDKKRLLQKKISCKTTNVQQAGYYIITVKTGNNKVNWKKIKRMAGDSAKYIIAPTSVTLPEGMKRYDSTAYRRQILFNTFLKSIGKCNRRNLSLGIVDADSRYCSLLPILLKSAATVTVYTQCKEEYEKVSDQAFKTFGSAPMLTDDIYMLNRCACVFSPSNFNTFNMTINEYLFGYGGFNLSGEDILLPNPFCGEIPKSIDPLDYAAALSERCNITELNSIYSEVLIRQGKKISLSRLQYNISSLT